MAGMVVAIIFLICENTSVPVTAGARFVVSDKGEILSPKKAPETTAPAVQYMGISKPSPMPISASPTVPTLPQLVPNETETTAQITMPAAIKKSEEKESLAHSK